MVFRTIWMRGRKIFLFEMNNVFLILPFGIPLWISSPGQGHPLTSHCLKWSEMLHWREEKRQEYQAGSGTSHSQGTGPSTCSCSLTCWPRQTLPTIPEQCFGGSSEFIFVETFLEKKRFLQQLLKSLVWGHNTNWLDKQIFWNILIIFLLDKSQSIQILRCRGAHTYLALASP